MLLLIFGISGSIVVKSNERTSKPESMTHTESAIYTSDTTLKLLALPFLDVI